MAVTLLAATLAALALGQGVEAYAGSWIAEFGGKTFVRLELSASNGSLEGRIAIGNIQVDEQGRVKEAEDAPNTLTPVSELMMGQAMLSFAHKDGNDTDRFSMRLGSGGRADLEFVLDAATRQELAANGIAVPKPVALKRVPR